MVKPISRRRYVFVVVTLVNHGINNGLGIGGNMSSGITNSGYEQTLEDILDDLHIIRSRFESKGISINPSCRLCLFEREIQKTIIARNLKLPPSDLNWSLLTEGYRDANELKLITSSDCVLDGGVPILRQILGGTVLPSKDNNSIARDKQFELFLAAILERTGFEVSLEEPDIVFTSNSQTYSLAAKRVKSEQKIAKRYREAIQQVKRCDYPGFIGMSLDYLIREDADKNIIAGSSEAMDKAGNNILLSFLMDKLGPKIAPYQDEQVIGLLMSVVLPSFLPASLSFGCVSVLRAFYLQDQATDVCRRIGSNTFRS